MLTLTALEAAYLATFRTKISDSKRRATVGLSHDACLALGTTLRAKLGLAPGASLRDYLSAPHEQKCGSLSRTVSSDPCENVADGRDGLCTGCREFQIVCEQNDRATQP